MTRVIALLFGCLFPFVIQAQHFELEKIPYSQYTSDVKKALFFDDQTIAYCGGDVSVHFIDLSTLKRVQSIECTEGGTDDFAFSPNRNYMVSTSQDNEIVCYDMEEQTSRNIGYYEPGYVQTKSIAFAKKNSSYVVNQSCNFLHCTIADEGVDTIQPLLKDCQYEMAFKKKGKMAYAGGNDNVWLYDVKNQSIKATQSTSEISVVNAIAVSPNQKKVVVAGREGIMVLDKKLKPQFALNGHTDWVNDVKFSPNGKHIYSCAGSFLGDDHTVRVWDANSGECTAVLEGHKGDVNNIDVSPDGRLLLSASEDLTIKIWDAKTKKLLCTIVPMYINGDVQPMVYSPSGVLYGPEEFFEIDGAIKTLTSEVKSSAHDEASRNALVGLLKR